MKIETGWNHCTFISEFHSDDNILTDLVDTLDEPTLKNVHLTRNEAGFLKLEVTTYF